MNQIIAYLFFIVSFEAYAIKIQNYETCINKLTKATGVINEHRVLSKGQKFYTINDNLYFNDRAGKMRFVPGKLLISDKSTVLLPNNEYYLISKNKNGILMSVIKEKPKGIRAVIAKILDPQSSSILKGYSFLIEKYSSSLIEKMKERKKYKDRHSEFNPDGIKEYSALKLCSKTAEIDNNTKLKKILDQHILKIPLYSDLKLQGKDE